MTTILHFILFFLLAPAIAIVAQAAGTVQEDSQVVDADIRAESDILGSLDGDICNYESSGALLHQCKSIGGEDDLIKYGELETPAATQPFFSFLAELVATNKVADLSSELARTGDDARRTLRNALGLGRGSADEAHHLIPVGLADHSLVQRAARGGFNFNGLDNGMALVFDRHRGVNIFHHNKYNNAVETVLNAQLRRTPNMTDAQAAEFLRDYANQLRNGIQNSTGRLR